MSFRDRLLMLRVCNYIRNIVYFKSRTRVNETFGPCDVRLQNPIRDNNTSHVVGTSDTYVKKDERTYAFIFNIAFQVSRVLNNTCFDPVELDQYVS